MVLAMCCKIIFHKTERGREEIVLHKVTDIEFESSFRDITDRGQLTLPRRALNWLIRSNIRGMFSRGDAITVYFGYNGNLIKEFEGYITEVSADMPIVIKFEDEMFKVKQIPVNFSSSNISLEQLLKKIIPDYKIEAQEGIQLGSVRLPNTRVGAVLDSLLNDWGLYTYMKGKTVICGKYYSDDSNEEIVKFHLERNCVSTALNYRKKEDINIIFKYSSTDIYGQKINVEFGDKDFETVVTGRFNNIKLKAELEKLAQEDYKRSKKDKMEGSFTAFGIPSVRHGLKCELKSDLYKDRNGIYYIESVTKTFSINGIRQDIRLGNRVN